MRYPCKHRAAFAGDSSATLAVVGWAMRYLLAMIAASAGVLSAASAVLASLPLDFPLPIVLLQHLDPRRQSKLATIMGRRTVLPVTQAVDHQDLIAGAVY